MVRTQHLICGPGSWHRHSPRAVWELGGVAHHWTASQRIHVMAHDTAHPGAPCRADEALAICRNLLQDSTAAEYADLELYDFRVFPGSQAIHIRLDKMTGECGSVSVACGQNRKGDCGEASGRAMTMRALRGRT